jgi:hypothetical protein
MDEKTRRECLEVNALLMAIHHDEGDAIEAILDDAKPNQAELLLRTVFTLKSMADMLITALDEIPNVDTNEVDFASLVQVNAEFLMQAETTAEEE